MGRVCVCVCVLAVEMDVDTEEVAFLALLSGRWRLSFLTGSWVVMGPLCFWDRDAERPRRVDDVVGRVVRAAPGMPLLVVDVVVVDRPWMDNGRGAGAGAAAAAGLRGRRLGERLREEDEVAAWRDESAGGGFVVGLRRERVRWREDMAT